jgi:hypothetical protein
MARPSVIDDLIIRKTHNTQNTLRAAVIEIAKDGERVGDLIDRAVALGIGNRRQVRAAIYLGAKSVNRRFRLVERGTK